MIGVVANPADYPVVGEFFELFKTPWEFYRRDGWYDVLLCCGDSEIPVKDGKLTIIYADRRTPFDARQDIEIASERQGARLLSLNGVRTQIYGGSVTFREGVSDSVMIIRRVAGKTVARVGYDLFEEVRSLLTTGQPASNASFPALDLHISALRDVIVASGVRLVEIPPVPDGYRFVACLTHDVDHPSLRRHRFDHTMFGFLYRATSGSMIRFIRGRLPLRGLLCNWAAALKLPLVHLGLAQDFWRKFARYTTLEKGAPSTFFVIPFGNRAGQNAPRLRRSRYGAADIADQVRALMSAGCEIGLHGIDAWCDHTEGLAELKEIRQITAKQEVGVRMHWLYYDERSPANLERAGFDYDSTMGYNETIGYRQGTSQVYKPLQTRRLLELPLHVMDTALFYPSHLGLSFKEAWQRVGGIINNAVELGGCVTVNWHDRSIAPERLWGEFYSDLAGELKNQGAWFATGAQAVAWFRKRRSARFETVGPSGDVHVTMGDDVIPKDLPGLQLLIHGKPGRAQTLPV